MKLPAGIEKWGSGVLGLVSVLLLANIVGQVRGNHARASQPRLATQSSARVRAGKGLSRSSDDLARYDPAVHLEELKELDARPLPDLERNIFDFVESAPSPAAPTKQVASQTATPVAAAAPSPQPPPPPPVLLKPVGYNEMPGGVKEAFASYEDQVLVVHEGDVVASKYKILKITPSAITVEDDSSHQTVELPIPQ